MPVLFPSRFSFSIDIINNISGFFPSNAASPLLNNNLFFLSIERLSTITLGFLFHLGGKAGYEANMIIFLRIKRFSFYFFHRSSSYSRTNSLWHSVINYIIYRFFIIKLSTQIYSKKKTSLYWCKRLYFTSTLKFCIISHKIA